VPASFQYGIEHECALLRSDGRFADFTNTSYAELAAVVDALPDDAVAPAGLRTGRLRVDGVAIRRKRWYVEGYERYDDAGAVWHYDVKGLETRTPTHDDPAAAVATLAADQACLDAAAAARGLTTTVIGFNPVRSEYAIDPPFSAWERERILVTPEDRSDHLHMTTYGPDLNLSWGAGPDELVDAARKLTALSPYLVPLSFSSPFRDGSPWGGLSARTEVRTGVRPAVLGYVGPDVPVPASDPTLVQRARSASEVGRLEFKAFDACPDLMLYAELMALLTGLVLDTTLSDRATTPDTALHRSAARTGYADPDLRAGAQAALDAASAAVADRPADAAGLAALRARFDRDECPARDMLARYAAGHAVAGLRSR
jgi:Glutamate-cysteine ligase family 2(GCS2)